MDIVAVVCRSLLGIVVSFAIIGLGWGFMGLSESVVYRVIVMLIAFGVTAAMWAVVFDFVIEPIVKKYR